MDPYFTYYHCISQNEASQSTTRKFICTRRDDPVQIISPPDAAHFVIPVHHWIPDFCHKEYIRHTAQRYYPSSLIIERVPISLRDEDSVRPTAATLESSDLSEMLQPFLP